MSNIYIQEPPTQGKVLLQSTAGELEIELWSKEAPLACRNFVQLCMEGYYDGTIFHRVIPGFIAQGGDPTGTGEGGESIYGGKPFKDEFHSRLRFVRRGLVAMANSGPNDNQSQFFFTLGVCKELDKKHTIFGKVAGDTLYNLPRFEEGEIDKDDRPVYPHKVTSTEVLLNPFDDIVPRSSIDNEVPKEDRKKKRRKGVKNFSLLSFGGEAQEEEAEVITATKAMGGAGGGHPSLLPADATIPLPERDGARERIREKLKRLTAPDNKSKEKERVKENDQKLLDKDTSKNGDSTRDDGQADDSKKPGKEDDRHKRHRDKKERSSSRKRDRSDDEADVEPADGHDSGRKDKKKRRHSRGERKSSREESRGHRDSDRSSRERDNEGSGKTSKDGDRSSKGKDKRSKDKDKDNKDSDKTSKDADNKDIDRSSKDEDISSKPASLPSKAAESVESGEAASAVRQPPLPKGSSGGAADGGPDSAQDAGSAVRAEKRKRRRFEDRPPDSSSAVLPPLPPSPPPPSSTSAGAPAPTGGGEDPKKEKKLAEMRAEIKQLKRELTGRDSSKSKKIPSSAGQESKVEPQPAVSAVQEYQQEKEKYVQLKRAIPKKGAAREDITLAMFEKFNKKMKLAITVKNGEQEEGEEEELTEEDSWLHEKVLFDDDTPVMARDASTKDDTWYSLDDPRHPLNKRRRGENDKAVAASGGGSKKHEPRGGGRR